MPSEKEPAPARAKARAQQADSGIEWLTADRGQPAPPEQAQRERERRPADKSVNLLAAPTSADLTPEVLLGSHPEAPRYGWQRTLHRLTGGRLDPGPSRRERAERDMEARLKAPVHGCRRIAVMALKGGVGKTTAAACVAATFALHRGDRVVAVDASPGPGTLGYRIGGQSQRTARQLLANSSRLEKYSDMRAFASQTTMGLDVLASEPDPMTMEAFGEDGFRRLDTVLERFYSLVLVDCGPGVLHASTRSILERAHQLVVVSAPSLDGARSASLTLDWLERHKFGGLAQSAVAVINFVRPRARIDLRELEDHFTQRCRAVVRVPFDRHLETGSHISLDKLAPRTQRAFLELAAAVADGFALGDPTR